MALFKDIDEVKTFLAVNITANFDQILPYINQVTDKYIKNDILGPDLLDELQDYYDADSMPEEYEQLLAKVQQPLINFAFFLAMSNLNLQITGAGFVVTANQNMAPASQQRTDALKADLQAAGYDGIENLLRFLEENDDQFSLWESSDAYTEHYRFFLKDAREFDVEVNINRSRRQFLLMRQCMRNVEKLQIEPVISKDLADAIKTEIKNDSVSAANLKILPLLKSALANLTAALEIDPKFEETGQHYLSQVKKIIDTTPDDYPLYKESGCYDADKTGYEIYVNQEDNPTFNMGGPR